MINCIYWLFHNEYIKLSWLIIEHKLRYYTFHDSIISDYEFDNLERRYLYLCEHLDLINTVCHKSYPGITAKGNGMMEIDITRPSVLLVYDKIIRRG